MSVGIGMMLGPIFGTQIQKIDVIAPLYASMCFLIISCALG